MCTQVFSDIKQSDIIQFTRFLDVVRKVISFTPYFKCPAYPILSDSWVVNTQSKKLKTQFSIFSDSWVVGAPPSPSPFPSPSRFLNAGTLTLKQIRICILLNSLTSYLYLSKTFVFRQKYIFTIQYIIIERSPDTCVC